MHAIGYLIISLAKILSLLVNIYTFIIAGAVIISWVNADPYNPIVRFLRQATEPIFWRVRRILPQFLFRTGLDFTPIVVLILLILIENVVVNLLFEWGQRFLVK
ncbi:MAG: YggT family protein [bacterium]